MNWNRYEHRERVLFSSNWVVTLNCVCLRVHMNQRDLFEVFLQLGLK